MGLAGDQQVSGSHGSTEGDLRAYITGVKFWLITFTIGVIVFFVVAGLIFLPVYICWQGPAAAECFAPGNGILVLLWLGVGVLALAT